MGVDIYVQFKKAYPSGNPNNRADENMLSCSSNTCRELFKPLLTESNEQLKCFSLEDFSSSTGTYVSPEQAEHFLIEAYKNYTKAQRQKDYHVKSLFQLFKTAAQADGFVVL